jgi:hypothetical protein
MIGRALIPDHGQGGIASAFGQLETRLRQPYARALTEEDRQHIRAYLTARMDVIVDLLNHVAVPDRVWPDDDPIENADG